MAAQKRSAERAALAAAIEEKRTRDAERSVQHQAYDAAVELIHESYGVTGGIEQRLRNRPQHAAARLMARAGGDEELDEPQSTVDLRKALADAEATLDDRKSVRDALKTQIETFSFDGPAERVRTAAVAVLRCETPDYVAASVSRIHELAEQLARVRADLGWLDTYRVFGDTPREKPVDVSRATAPLQSETEKLWSAARASSSWVGVFEGLMRDADFKLPGQ